MGALTNELTAFQYRPWETELFVTIDDTESTSFLIRLEKIRGRRVRFLPLGYWISNFKRYHKSLSYTTHLQPKSMCQISYACINFELFEEVHKVYVSFLSAIKAAFYSNKVKVYFTARKVKMINNITIFNDLLLVNSKQQQVLENKDDLNDFIYLLCNLRLYPDIYTHIFTNEFEITSLSYFNTNFLKNEIPLSNYSFSSFFKGLYDSTNSTILVDYFTPIQKPTLNLYSIKPLYLDNYNHIFSKNLSFSSYGLLSYKLFDLFKTPYISINESNESHILISFNGTDIFDKFIYTKLSHKLLYRLVLIASFTKLSLTKKLTNKKLLLLSNKLTNDQA